VQYQHEFMLQVLNNVCHQCLPSLRRAGLFVVPLFAGSLSVVFAAKPPVDVVTRSAIEERIELLKNVSRLAGALPGFTGFKNASGSAPYRHYYRWQLERHIWQTDLNKSIRDILYALS